MIYVKKYRDDCLYLSTDLYKKINSQYIQVLFNKNSNEVAFVGCSKNDEESICLIKCHIDHTNFVRHEIGRKNVCSLFEKGKRYMGKYYKKYNCVIINLGKRK